MKILYIKQNVSVIRNCIDQAVVASFQRLGAEIEEFDFANFFFTYKDVFSKYRTPSNMSYDAGLVERVSNEITSAMIPKLALHQHPDFIFLINGDVIDPATIHILKKTGFKIVCWQVDDPYTIDKTSILSPYLERIFSVDESSLAVYRFAGCNDASFLPLGFIESVYRKQPVDVHYHSDVCFIGTPFAGSYRIKILDELIPFFVERNIQFKIIGSHVHGQTWANALKNYDQAKNSIHEDFVLPEDTAKYYCGAKIVLNIHRDSFFGPVDSNKSGVIGVSLNERAFNIGACGVFQIIDDTRDFKAFFEEGKEIEVFRNINDLKEKISLYLNNDALRNSIANQCHQKVLSNHSLTHKVDHIIKSLSHS